MTINDYAFIIILISIFALLFYCPIIKPWFGFKRPKGHNGKWFT
jgi:4-hydroxybenzoate polyprenyltransferase